LPTQNDTRADTDQPLLSVKGLKTWFPVRRGFLGKKRYVHAVDGVDLVIRRGRTLGLVGESGSGKTTVGRTILRLVDATEGQVRFDGADVLQASRADVKRLRGRMQVIFQDPVGSLNPRMTVGSIVGEPLAAHGLLPGGQRRKRVAELLERVGLSARYINRYPHEFSGGQRQRIGIARALAVEPEFIVCDEPVSALDVSIQAQVLNLLADLQAEMNITYLFIAHNLAVVEHFADEVAVMYLGRVVETAPRDQLYENPTHPYTQALLSAVPQPVPAREKTRIALPGEIPSPISPPSGCTFHPRCPLTRERAAQLKDGQTATILSEGEPVRVVRRCTREVPELTPLAGDSHHCHACLLRQDAGR
jgi:oligopeptide/dipeptide ABC transporter ATP-binding protein